MQNPKTKNQVVEIVKNISYKKEDWSLNLSDNGGRGWMLQVKFLDIDLDNPGEKILQSCRKFYISRYMTESEIVSTAFLAIKQAEEHEIREKFTYKGVTVFGPHLPVNELIEFVEGHKMDSRS